MSSIRFDGATDLSNIVNAQNQETGVGNAVYSREIDERVSPGLYNEHSAPVFSFSKSLR